jgi:hypothetical protein
MTTNSEGKPSLRVIEGSGISLPGHYTLPTDGDFILPPVKLSLKEIFSTWVAMTSRQSHIAFYDAAARDSRRAAGTLNRERLNVSRIHFRGPF